MMRIPGIVVDGLPLVHLSGHFPTSLTKNQLNKLDKGMLKLEKSTWTFGIEFSYDD